MFKIEFVPTGHVFELPDMTAQELKDKFPSDYKILEKNGKKYRDRLKKKREKINENSLTNHCYIFLKV